LDQCSGRHADDSVHSASLAQDKMSLGAFVRHSVAPSTDLLADSRS
jgi:hypothetical protein